MITGEATDNLILHAAVADATRVPTSGMAFFTLNRKDFTDAAVTTALENAAVTPMFNSSHVVAWLKTP